MSVHEIGGSKPDISLNLRTVLNDLVADGRLSTSDADELSLKTRRKDQLDWNPLEMIAEEEKPDQKNPGDYLTAEALTLWLCERANQPYKRIDPLKIDAQVVTRVMSHEFAKRHGILALEVKDDEVVIASAQPYVSGWEATILQSQPGKLLTRVISNPSD
ncbi:MAG: type II/IV secretion system protein, partial [Pseudomonadales bacterium]